MGTTKKILCPVDFSAGSERAVAQAEDLAKALNAQVELLHVYQLPVLALPDSTITVSPTYVADLTNRAQEALDKHRVTLTSHGVEATVKLVEGNPAEAIAERAKEIDAAMVVIGTHGRSGFRRFLLGSVAERVVRTAPVPVLTVHVPE